MSRSVTFGVVVGQELALRADGSFDADAYADVIALAERLGFNHVLPADHVFVPPYWAKVIPEFFLDPLELLTYLAARTSQIELVVSCLVVPYRQPFATAKAIATIDQLSGGRFALGVVPGYLKEEYETFRLPLQERNEITNEFVRIMIELWTSDVATYHGQYYDFEGLNVKPKCQRQPHVPIWVGGSSRNALRRVAEFGDCWHPIGFTVVDDAYKAANREELADKPLPTSGTTPRRLRRDLGEIAGLAEERSRDISELQVVVLAGKPVEDLSSARAPGSDIPSDDRTVDWYGQYLDAGATGLVFSARASSLSGAAEQLEQFAEGPMRQLRPH
jgi:probable F420-dependent oxidoreductase